MEDLTKKQKLLIHLNEVKNILESCSSLDDEEIAYYQNFNAIIFEDILKPMVNSNQTVT